MKQSRHDLLGDDDAVAATSLGLIQGSVGALDERILVFLWEPKSDPYADGNARLVIDRGCDRGANALRNGQGGHLVDSGQEDKELFATVPKRDVTESHLLSDGIGDMLENTVAHRVSETVVDVLEMIDVYHQRGDLPYRVPIIEPKQPSCSFSQ